MKQNIKRDKYVALQKGTVIAILTGFFVLLVVLLNRTNVAKGLGQAGSMQVQYEHATVLKITQQSLKKDPDTGYQNGTQMLQIRIDSGKYQSNVLTIKNYLSNYSNVVATQGGTLVVRVSGLEQKPDVAVFSYYRAPYIYALIILFFIVLSIVGGRRGIRSAASLVVSFLCILFIYIPSVLRGASPLLMALIIAGYITLVSMIFLSGFSRKTWTAIIGTLAGVLFSAGIAVLSGALMHLNGFNSPESETLIQLSGLAKIQVGGVLFGGIIIAALGAIIDIAVSIASSMDELNRHAPDMGTHALFASGMNIGRDMVGTMANTLILAFAGSSMMELLLIVSNNIPYNQLLNTPWIGIEVIESLSGSIGVILTVPLIAYIGAKLIPVLSVKEKPKNVFVAFARQKKPF
ncbi:MAG: YibE/F family protein [Ethanoligenens sp.]